MTDAPVLVTVLPASTAKEVAVPNAKGLPAAEAPDVPVTPNTSVVVTQGADHCRCTPSAHARTARPKDDR
jgi:hypothetical protein